jgi:beta-N-acetylhexosaminidase
MLSRAVIALAGIAALLYAYTVTRVDGDATLTPRGAAALAATAEPLATLTPAPTARAKPTARPRSMTLEAAIGQRIITGYHGATPPASVLRAVRAGRVGGVILFGENVPTVPAARSAVRAVKRAAAAGRRPEPLIMIDQEGGQVRRLPTLPPTLSPAQMGATSGPAATAEHQGRLTGAALRRLGITVDLAPVADVPLGTSSFLGERAFSRSRDVVARAACGFAEGLARSKVAATLKHFPGLGRAGGNTDLRPVDVTGGRAELEADLSAYRRCARTTPLVMISSATYPRLGIDAPAVLDRSTYRLLDSTGFRGLTITDAFDTPAVATQVRPALKALRAGVDLLLYGMDQRGAAQAYSRLLADARAGRLSRGQVRARADRIVAFKRRLAAGRLEDR